MIYCQNCGHESHCGINFMQVARNGRGEFLGEIVVCKQCRCELCVDVPYPEKWPGPGV